MPKTSPLAGVRVLECGGWAGAYAGKLLAEAGADVVRVVPPGGDPLAAEPPFFGETGVSIQETWYNLGKRVIDLDLAADSGRFELERLALASDVLIEDWAPGAEPLSANSLAANAALVRVSITHGGRDSPPLMTNDLVSNALCMWASLSGNAETPPLAGYGNQTYHVAGIHAAVCALAGYRAARLTGRGTHFDLSTLEALASCSEYAFMKWFSAGPWGTAPTVHFRSGAQLWTGSFDIYPDRDGKGMHVTVALGLMEEIIPWLAADGMERDLADRDRFPILDSLTERFPYLMDTLREWVATKEANALFEEGQAKHLPWSPVFELREVLASPQIGARGYLQPREVAGAGVQRLPMRAFRTDADGEPPPAATRIEIRDLVWERRPAPPPPTVKIPPLRPLEGIRILDFTHVLAGPHGTRLLADLGADVIKLGTALRSGGMNNVSHPFYTWWNRGKRSIHIDMAQERGRELARQLATKCDAITENFSAGVLGRWGMDRKSLAGLHPKITVVSMGGTGQSGPWKDFVTYAPTIHALTGVTAMTTFPDRRILGYGFSLADHLGGLASALAILEGIEHAARTGEGLDVDLSQYEVGLGVMAPGLIDQLANGIARPPSGNRHPFGAWAPHGIYRAAGGDAWIAIAVRGDDQWRALCGLMERPEYATDARFATHGARLANQDALDEGIQDWTRGRDRYAVMAACQAAGIAAGAVQDVRDFVTRDRVVAARGFFGEAQPSAGGRPVPADSFPALLDGRRPDRTFAAHESGADTFEVLQEILGLDDDAVAELMAAGVLV